MTNLLTVTLHSQTKSSFSTRGLHCRSSENCSNSFLECDQSTGSGYQWLRSGDFNVIWEFQCKFSIHIWFIVLTSLLDESSTPMHFEVLCYCEVKHMTLSERIFLCFQYDCLHFTKIYCNQVLENENILQFHWNPVQYFIINYGKRLGLITNQPTED